MLQYSRDSSRCEVTCRVARRLPWGRLFLIVVDVPRSMHVFFHVGYSLITLFWSLRAFSQCVFDCRIVPVALRFHACRTRLCVWHCSRCAQSQSIHRVELQLQNWGGWDWPRKSIHSWAHGAGSWRLSTLGSVWSMNYGCGQESSVHKSRLLPRPGSPFDNFGNISRAMQVLLCPAWIKHTERLFMLSELSLGGVELILRLPSRGKGKFSATWAKRGGENLWVPTSRASFNLDTYYNSGLGWLESRDVIYPAGPVSIAIWKLFGSEFVVVHITGRKCHYTFWSDFLWGAPKLQHAWPLPTTKLSLTALLEQPTFRGLEVIAIIAR